MKRLLTILTLIGLAAVAVAANPYLMVIARKNASGEAQQIYGNSDESGDSTSTTANLTRSLKITPSADVTITHGWIYFETQDGTAGTWSMSIFHNGGTQMGSCSTTGTLPASGNADWAASEVTFGSPIVLTNGVDYFISANCSESILFYYETVTSGDSLYNFSGTCPQLGTIASTLGGCIAVANYDAK